MIREQRIALILGELKKRGIVSISELTRTTSSSRSTLYRDLCALEEQGLLKTIRGGAVAPSRNTAHEPSFSARQSQFSEEKQRIAQAALDYIQENETVLLDSGTTGYELAKLLASSKHLYIATNDLNSALALSANPDISLVVLGGKLRTSHFALSGLFTEDMIRQIHADTVFLSVDAVDLEAGFMCYNLDEVPSKRLMVQASQKVIVLCDHSKFESVAFVRICALTQVDLVITGQELRVDIRAKLEELGVKLLLI